MTTDKRMLWLLGLLMMTVSVSSIVRAQGREPYPDAVTNQQIYQETPMAPPSPKCRVYGS
jgi:hypothetical protein